MSRLSERYPLNLTNVSSVSHYSGTDMTVHEIRRMFQPYFAPVVIGTFINSAGYINRIYNVPLIMLFLDEKYRREYLNYSVNLTDETSLTLRRILSDEDNIERRLQKIVKKIGNVCLQRGIPVFEYKTVSYTDDNYKEDGAREIFRIAVNKSKSDKPGVHDLTELYFAPTIDSKKTIK